MRYLHLFLVFNFVMCYAGICGDTVLAVVSPPGAGESCHGSGHEMAEAGENTLDIKSNGEEYSQKSPCCLDYLNGSSTDNPDSVSTVIEVLTAKEIYSKKLKRHNLVSELRSKGHDPPDLQISYSSFLL